MPESLPSHASFLDNPLIGFSQEPDSARTFKLITVKNSEQQKTSSYIIDLDNDEHRAWFQRLRDWRILQDRINRYGMVGFNAITGAMSLPENPYNEPYKPMARAREFFEEEVTREAQIASNPILSLHRTRVSWRSNEANRKYTI